MDRTPGGRHARPGDAGAHRRAAPAVPLRTAGSVLRRLPRLGLRRPRRGHPSQACPHATLIGIDRDQHALALAGRRRELASRPPGCSCSRPRYDELPEVLDEAGPPQGAGDPRSTWGCRRCRSTAGNAASPTSVDAAPRHAHGQTTQPLTAADLVNDLHRRASWPRSCAGSAKSGSPTGSPRHRRASARRDRSSPRRGSSRCCRESDSGCRPGAPAAIRRSAPSRRCGSRSTTSSPRWSRRCRPRSRPSRLGRPARRAGLPLRRGPAGEERAARRDDRPGPTRVAGGSR